MESDFITIREVAEYLKIKEKTVYKLASENVIPGFKVGGSWRFSKTEIEQWVEKQKNQKKEDSHA
jgi:excisionase family DNA binding protein